MLIVMLTGAAIGALLCWFVPRLLNNNRKSIPVEVVQPQSWSQDDLIDLNTVLSDLGNIYNHAYINRNHLKRDGIYTSPMMVRSFWQLLNVEGMSDVKFFLNVLLAYEELNLSVGSSNRDLFNRWKNLINSIKKDVPKTVTSFMSSVLKNKLKTFYLAAVKAYWLGEINFIASKAESAPYLWADPRSGLTGDAFFNDSIWKTYTWISTNCLGIDFKSVYDGFLSIDNGITLEAVPSVKTLTQEGIMNKIKTDGISSLSEYLTNHTKDAIEFVNKVAPDKTLSSLM